MKRLWIVAGAIVATVGVLWAASSIPAVDDWIVRWTVMRVVAAPVPRLADDGELALLLCGTGSPLPDKGRAGPCTLIAAGKHLYLVDAGLDSARNLLLWHIPLENVDGILITHFHSDHIAELGELRLQTWVAGRTTPLKVYGPPGIETVVDGFNQAYSLDAGYRTAHHGAAMLPPDAVAMVPVPIAVGLFSSAPVLAKDGLRITAIRVIHNPANPAYGYRFDFAGRSITISGDTAPSENLARAARGTDILVHEGLSPAMVAMLRDAALAAGRTRPAKIFHDIPSYHSSPIAAAGIANEAGVRLLLFSHLLPPLPNGLAERVFLRGVRTVRPDGVEVGHDGYLARLPAGSDRIERDDLE